MDGDGIIDLPGVTIAELRRRAALALPIPYEQRLRERLRISGFLEGDRHMKWSTTGSHDGGEEEEGLEGVGPGPGQGRRPKGLSYGSVGSTGSVIGGVSPRGGSERSSSAAAWSSAADSEGVVWLARQGSRPQISISGGGKEDSRRTGRRAGGSRGAGKSGTAFRLDAHSWVRQTDQIGRAGSGSPSPDASHGDAGGISGLGAIPSATIRSVRPGLELLREDDEVRRRRLGLDWGERRRAMHLGRRDGSLSHHIRGGHKPALPPRVAGMKAALARLAAASQQRPGPAIEAARRRWLAWSRKERRRKKQAAKGK